MNYEPVTAGNQTNGDAGIETNVNAGQAGQEKASDHEYILLPLMLSNSPLFSSTQSTNDKDADEVPDKGDNYKEGYANSTNRDSTASPSVSSAGPSINTASENINIGSPDINTASPILNDSSIQSLENTGIFDDAYDDREVGAEADLNNLDTTMNVWTLVDLPKGKRAIRTKWVYKNKKDERGIIVRNKARLVAQGYTQEEGIDYDEVFAPIARIEAIRLFLAYASFMGLIVYQMDVKSAFLYGTIEEEVEKALYGLHQASRAWYETLSTYLLENGFRRGTINKTLFIKKEKDNAQEIPDDFYGELTFFLGLHTASTLMVPNKALVKDEEADNVDAHLYKSMIRSLMYLTASRPDITFVVCACAWFQITPKVLHLYAVKRIFRYLKGQPKLGLWYPRDSPFDLEAFSDSDYAGASLDRKSTTREYVAAANCCGQNPKFHAKTKHIEIRHHFIRDSYEKRLIQVIKVHSDHNVVDLLTKAFDFSRLMLLGEANDVNMQSRMDGKTCNIKQKCVMSQTPRQIKRGRDTKIPQSSDPFEKVGDEAVHKELGDRMERAATTASSLIAEQY
ncbi:putative ribonuclease H-like domain-containing protein [Tanacetum coccineum]|uniref:Ribonuclease H-like domain-containing protein n=1 Tax=Tanacetum coccineum TaxID=301880 RepID=A0ABQ4WLS0_9ASTR